MAVDGGLVVQPDAARANIESGINYGLSSVLHERVTVKQGAVVQSNYNDYQVMRMSDVPEEIHVEFINAGASEPTGLGELGNPPIGAAVAGAFYRLTGKRLSHMPFTRKRVLAALNA
jgi:isoquinoline 1-oxidoreductase beta subunit